MRPYDKLFVWSMAATAIVVLGCFVTLTLVANNKPDPEPGPSSTLSPGAQSYSNGQNYGRQLETKGYGFDEAYEACRERSGDDDVYDSLLFSQGCQAGFVED